MITSNYDNVLNAWNTKPFATNCVKQAETREIRLSLQKLTHT